MSVFDHSKDIRTLQTWQMATFEQWFIRGSGNYFSVGQRSLLQSCCLWTRVLMELWGSCATRGSLYLLKCVSYHRNTQRKSVGWRTEGDMHWLKQKERDEQQKQRCNRTQRFHLGNVGVKWGKGMIKNTRFCSGILTNTGSQQCDCLAQKALEISETLEL